MVLLKGQRFYGLYPNQNGKERVQVSRENGDEDKTLGTLNIKDNKKSFRVSISE